MSEVDRRVPFGVRPRARCAAAGPPRRPRTCECGVSERRRASFRFGYEIRNEADEAVATGSTLHACWDPSTSKMIAVPDWLVAIMPVVATPG